MSDLSFEEAIAKAEREKAERAKATSEKMTAYGYDPTNEAEIAKFQELEAKRAAGRIEQQDVLRGMEKFHFEREDKERRDAAKEAGKSQEQQSQDREEARKQLERYERGNPHETERTTVRAEFEKYMNTTHAVSPNRAPAPAARDELQNHIAEAERKETRSQHEQPDRTSAREALQQHLVEGANDNHKIDPFNRDRARQQEYER